MNGAPHPAGEPNDASCPVAQAADAVQRGVNAGTVVTTKLPNLQSMRVRFAEITQQKMRNAV
jgi:hypothetical protein